jgi:ethanolamine ammonia-lyase small subunit
MMSQEQIARIVREIVSEVQQKPAPAPVLSTSGRIKCEPDPRPSHQVEDPLLPEMLQRLVSTTTSQIATGRAGHRFKTDLYLRIREGHAEAKDAVHSEIPEDWPKKQGWLPLKSRCQDRHEYLLHPNHGRRLDDESLKALAPLAGTAPDVQVIAGDGLSPSALMKNGVQSVQALMPALSAAGFKTGPVLYTRFTRIGLQDEIGVVTKARATVILVGERPGLGTGDSLSFYIAVNPKLDQDNAEKNCISNVRPIGIRPEEAASLTVEILKRAFARGVGGLALGFGFQRQ